MSHRLGSIVLFGPQDIGPDAGAPTGPNTWEFTFPVDPLAKFVMLHLVGTSLAAGDHVEVDLGYDTDVYAPDWGEDFWSRPIRGDQAVTVRYVRAGGAGGGHVTLDRYGRGEAMAGGGAANGNADVFLLDTPYAEHSPAAQFSGGKFPAGSDPTWENVACLADATMADTARKVGMFIDVDLAENKVSSCSATLIAPDLIITAGHCVTTDALARTGSITFDFQTDCVGNRPVGYNPKFHKLKRVIKARYVPDQIDYSIMQIVTPPSGLGLAPVPLRPDIPAHDEPLFIVHHPRGAPKKISRFPIDDQCLMRAGSVYADAPAGEVYFNCDIDNGSSGSSIFDAAGRIVANLSFWDWGTSSKSILEDLATAPAPAKDLDVVMVLDRSGSMSLPGFGTPETKLQQAQRAAELFVSLLRNDEGHRVGLVTFSTTPSAEFALAAIDDATKQTLIGPAPPGMISLITAGGSTTIGGGLQTGASLFPAPGPSANARAMLLLTDGLQNTDPSIEQGEAQLGATMVNAIGLGTDASLDGPRLTRLARDHGGIYWRAEEGLALKKYFALAFGNIFSLGTSLDPRFHLPAGLMSAAPVDVAVCGEKALTAIVGWDNPGAALLVSLETPAGAIITAGSPGVTAEAGSTWAHVRIALPFGAEQDGAWKVRVSRPGGGSEFPPPTPATSYFVMTLVDGGPQFYRLPQRPLYTGDVVNPRVALSPPEGAHMHATVTAEIESPLDGPGNVLTAAGPGTPGIRDGDPMDARAQRLIDLEQAKGAPLFETARRVVPLFDDGAHDDGAMEEDGVFGNPLPDVTRVEGTYTFHAVAIYGHECVGRREATWSVYVDVGIDPGSTVVSTRPAGSLPGGRERVCLTFTPRDRYGNYLGPGRAGSLVIGAQPGSELDGGLIDNGDGSYTQCVTWDPDAGLPPGISVGQPGRPPVLLEDPERRFHRYSVKFLCGMQPATPCIAAPLRPGRYATEINIHNPGAATARVRKRVVPLVLAGAALGREPRCAETKTSDAIILPPGSATMDDCCRIGELLAGAGAPGALTVGILEIVSSAELAVTAVYTVTTPAGRVDVDTLRVRRAGLGAMTASAP